MPDGADIAVPSAPVWSLNLTLAGGGPSDPKARWLLSSFIAAVDSAVLFYRHAHDEVQRYSASPNTAKLISAYFFASSLLEACIGAMHRACLLGDRIRRLQTAPALPKDVSVFSSGATRKIADMRHATQHMEEKIIREELPEDGYLGLAVCTRGVEFGGYRVSYGQLLRWLKQLVGVAALFAVYQEDGPGTSGDA